MKKKELKIIGLSYSQSQVGAYVVVLADKKSLRKLPLIIKPVDAQRIALQIEGIKPERPLVHDLFKSVSDTFGLDVQEVFIHSLLEGIFYTQIIVSNGLEEVKFELPLGDALALATLFNCPIYTTQEILTNAGIWMNDDGSTPEEEVEDACDEEVDELEEMLALMDQQNNLKVSIPDLEQIMNEAISNEEYEIAAKMRDRIQKLKEEEK